MGFSVYCRSRKPNEFPIRWALGVNWEAMKPGDFKIQVSGKLVAQALSAQQTLEKTKIGVLDAARLVKELSELGRTRKLNRLRTIFRLGCEVAAREGKTPSFELAYDYFLKSKNHLRTRTLQDYRQIRSVLQRSFPEIFPLRVRSIGPALCGQIIDSAFHTLLQRRKAYAILHSFFGYCIRHGWCRENPMSSTDLPMLREREIVPLTLPEIAELFRSASSLRLTDCVPAMALMLFAGIRPREIERLYWSDIDPEEKVISISPTHSKTGGSRHVSIFPVLEKILLPQCRHGSTKICPANWQRKWSKIRRNAGWGTPENPWRQDVLRHTFASYHLKFFKNLPQLQCEMGHASPRLLRTRYLSMRGVTLAAANLFWRGEGVF